MNKVLNEVHRQSANDVLRLFQFIFVNCHRHLCESPFQNDCSRKMTDRKVYTEWMKENAEQNIPAQSFTYFDNFRGIHFLNDLFVQYPELFETSSVVEKHSNAKGSFVYYLMYSGQVVKPQALFDEFEMFLKFTGDDQTKFGLINWARYLKETGIFYIFEPVLKLNNIVLQSFLQTRKIIWNDNTYTLDDLSPIAFTLSGENIAELLPYIAYLYNFLINCSPYEFNSIGNGNVQQIYIRQLNQYLESAWRKLIKNYPMMKLEQLYQSLDSGDIFEYINKSDIQTLLQDILSPETLLEIRNKIIENNLNLLDSCVKDQLSLSQDNVLQSFHEVLTRLTDIVISHSPITSIYNNAPQFHVFNPDMDIVWRIVEWCLTGAEPTFCINDDFEFLPLDSYHTKIKGIREMKIDSEVNKSTIIGKVPFMLSDPVRQIIIGYVKQEFTDLMNDLSVSTEEFMPGQFDAETSLEGEIFSIIANGYFSRYSSVVSEMFNKNLLSQADKLILDKLNQSVKKFYSNIFSSNLIRSYIFSFFCDNLLKHLVNPAVNPANPLQSSSAKSLSTTLSSSSSLNLLSNIEQGYYSGTIPKKPKKQSKQTINFSNFKYVCSSAIDKQRFVNIANIEYALMCVHNVQFGNIVNAMVSRITSIILHNSHIFQVYIKGTTDNIHPWAIGGITLAQRSIISNPIVRGCEFVRRCIGTNEHVECLLEWMSFLNDQTVNETTEDSLGKDMSLVRNLINSRFNTSKTKLDCLWNYVWKDGKLTKLTNAYFVDYINKVFRYCFSRQSPKNTQANELFWRPIMIGPRMFKTYRPNLNKFFIGKTECTSYIMENGEYCELPVLQYHSSMQTISIIYQPPSGLKVLKIISPSGLLPENNTFFIFSSAELKEEWVKKNIEFDGLTKMTIEGGTVKVNPNTL